MRHVLELEVPSLATEGEAKALRLVVVGRTPHRASAGQRMATASSEKIKAKVGSPP